MVRTSTQPHELPRLCLGKRAALVRNLLDFPQRYDPQVTTQPGPRLRLGLKLALHSSTLKPG